MTPDPPDQAAVIDAATITARMAGVKKFTVAVMMTGVGTPFSSVGS